MLIDCDTLDSGCNGGLTQYALTWIAKYGGVMTEADYPYRGTKGACRSDPSKYVDMKVTGFKIITDLNLARWCVDEDKIKELLYATAPLPAVLNADPLRTYISGIIDVSADECPLSGINLAVLIVGYGIDSTGKGYWIVKNSWGKNWGESGYFRIRRGNGTCGINCNIIIASISF